MSKIFKSLCLFIFLSLVGYVGFAVSEKNKVLLVSELKSRLAEFVLEDDYIKEEYLVAGSKNVGKSFKLKIEKEYDSKYQELFADVLERVKVGYVEEVKEKDLIENALNGMLSSLDPHSSYMTAEDFKEITIQTRGEFGGLGVEITMENSFVKVISPIEGTPAYKAGIKSGDYITHIDDRSVIGMSLLDAVKLMRGKPKSKIKLTVVREGEDKPLEFKIKRGIIKIKAVRGNREGNIAYLKINSFTEQTYGGLIKEFNRIENLIGKKNLRGVVLDLRDNPGGLLEQAIFISDMFLNEGQVILSVKGRNEKETDVYKDKRNEDLIPNIPMVVLINEGSASASEIVAGALQDNGRAIVMGNKSFGKGSVQSIVPVQMGGAIKMTIARYYTPSGRSIQAEGIEPDIVVKSARIEAIEGYRMFSEKSLKGHLEKRRGLTNVMKKNQLKTDNQALYEKDYQLARAIDLLLGISFYQDVNEKSSK